MEMVEEGKMTIGDDCGLKYPRWKLFLEGDPILVFSESNDIGLMGRSLVATPNSCMWSILSMPSCIANGSLNDRQI